LRSGWVRIPICRQLSNILEIDPNIFGFFKRKKTAMSLF
jgi:hypothetical protein